MMLTEHGDDDGHDDDDDDGDSDYDVDEADGLDESARQPGGDGVDHHAAQ